ncbi:hypothetical protein [Streptomyces sp. NPDC046832]|uniref:hypothetical protein n=1 Tax=Streptomyces sp. NPDC046832 TaxID=3155020 RepID=UPI003409F9A4
MFYIYVPGEGWVLRPGPFAPAGCVFAPGVPRSFGFSRTWLRVAGGVCGAMLAVLYVAGHEIEVITAVLAAVSAGALADLTRAAIEWVGKRYAARAPKWGTR